MIRDEEGSTFFMYIYLFLENGSKKLIFRKLKGTQGNLGFFKGSARRSRELKGTWVSSREALVEVMKGNKQKTQERGQKNSGKGAKKLRKRGKKTQEKGQKNSGKGAKKRKHRSALRALKN